MDRRFSDSAIIAIIFAYISKFKKLQTDMDTMGRMINEHVTNLTNMAKDYTSTESSNASATDVLSGNVIS